MVEKVKMVRDTEIALEKLELHLKKAMNIEKTERRRSCERDCKKSKKVSPYPSPSSSPPLPYSLLLSLSVSTTPSIVLYAFSSCSMQRST